MYERGSFLFRLDVPTSYPFHPPKIKCLTKLLHPLVNWRTGEVYVSMCRKDWKPVLSINHVILALQLMFLEVNAQVITTVTTTNTNGGGIITRVNAPVSLNMEATRLIETNKQQFGELVKATLKGNK